MLGINVPIPVSMTDYLFGGQKASLFGDHHIYGRDGAHLCTRTKGKHLALDGSRHRGFDL